MPFHSWKLYHFYWHFSRNWQYNSVNFFFFLALLQIIFCTFLYFFFGLVGFIFIFRREARQTTRHRLHRMCIFLFQTEIAIVLCSHFRLVSHAEMHATKCIFVSYFFLHIFFYPFLTKNWNFSDFQCRDNTHSRFFLFLLLSQRQNFRREAVTSSQVDKSFPFTIGRKKNQSIKKRLAGITANDVIDPRVYSRRWQIHQLVVIIIIIIRINLWNFISNQY